MLLWDQWEPIFPRDHCQLGQSQMINDCFIQLWWSCLHNSTFSISPVCRPLRSFAIVPESRKFPSSMFKPTTCLEVGYDRFAVGRTIGKLVLILGRDIQLCCYSTEKFTFIVSDTIICSQTCHRWDKIRTAIIYSRFDISISCDADTLKPLMNPG